MDGNFSGSLLLGTGLDFELFITGLFPPVMRDAPEAPGIFFSSIFYLLLALWPTPAAPPGLLAPDRM